MPKFISLLLVVLMTQLLSAQIVGVDIFPLNKEKRKGGLFIEPQINTTFGSKVNATIDQNHSLYSLKEKGNGNLGAGLEVGWFQSFKKKKYFIHYLEFSAAYSYIHGNVKHEGELQHLGNTFEYLSKNTFKNQYLTAAIRATNATQLGHYSYLSTSLGLNYNYILDAKYEYELIHPTFEEDFHNKHSLQLHLKVGLGFKTSPSSNTILMPTVWTPLLTAYPFDNINPAFPYFNSKFHPIFIGIKFLFLRDDPNCNTPNFN